LPQIQDNNPQDIRLRMSEGGISGRLYGVERGPKADGDGGRQQGRAISKAGWSGNRLQQQRKND
jgi:hypothetical protein